MRAATIILALVICSWAFAHEGHHHGEHTNTAKSEAPPNIKKVYEEINAEYITDVKPIFEMKCAACHSKSVEAPWYAKVPGVGWIVQEDRLEAKQHLEISSGFPFAGHGTPEEDLDALKDVVESGKMPTWLYSLMHSSSKLTEDEKSKILKWVGESKEKLKAVPQEEHNEHHK